MSHFYGKLQGDRGETTRRGTKNSGITTWAASWSGAVRTRVYYREDLDQDWVAVTMEPWHSTGIFKILYCGPVGKYENHEEG